MEACTWCELYAASLVGDLPHLCLGCAEEVERKDQAQKAHAAVDNHYEDCPKCRYRTGCETGSKLRADAAALDGRIDAEYAKVFAVVEPIAWYIKHSGAGFGQ